MITKFKITRLPVRATVEINATVIEQDYEYPISDQSNMTIQVNDRGVPYDDFGFRLGNEDNSWSPEYACVINKQVDSGDSVGTDIFLTHARFEGILLDPHFVWDEFTDRVKVVSIAPVRGVFYIDGEEIVIGETYYLYDFINVYFQHTDSSPESDLQTVLALQAGNKDGFALSGNFDVTLKSSGNLFGSVVGTTTISV